MRPAARLLLLSGRARRGCRSGDAHPGAPTPTRFSWPICSRLAASFASSSSLSSPSSSEQHHHHIAVSVDRASGVATLRLNRPRALNALSSAVCDEVVGAVLRLDDDASSGARAVVITGAPAPTGAGGCGGSSSSGSSAADPSDPKATPTPKPRRPVFAAGADIREMAGMTPRQAREGRLYQGWRRLVAARLPLVAAVNGVALGGGFELAMMCDVIVASEDAEFGLVRRCDGVVRFVFFAGLPPPARTRARALSPFVPPPPGSPPPPPLTTNANNNNKIHNTNSPSPPSASSPSWAARSASRAWPGAPSRWTSRSRAGG